MAKKYNRGRQQKRNIDRKKLAKYREEIARELGVELPGKKRRTGVNITRDAIPGMDFEDDELDL